jgi:hypothetical protein
MRWLWYCSGQRSSAPCLTAIAAGEEVTKRNVSRLIRPGHLALEIVDAVAARTPAPRLAARLCRLANPSREAQKDELGQIVQR